MRLIDAHKLQKAIYEHKTVRSITKDKVVEMIKEQPTVDPVKHGRWVGGKCSICGEHAPFWCMASTYYKSKYCPGCGATMDEVSD